MSLKVIRFIHRISYVTDWDVMSIFEPGVGVSKSPFVDFSVTGNFDLSEVSVEYVKLRRYLSVVSAAQLRDIIQITGVLIILKIGEKKRNEINIWVTPTQDNIIQFTWKNVPLYRKLEITWSSIVRLLRDCLVNQNTVAFRSLWTLHILWNETIPADSVAFFKNTLLTND